MLTSVKGKSVVVTGASKGIGKGIARVFAKNGAKVTVVARNAAQARKTAKEIGESASAFAADMTKLDELEKMAKAAAKKNGGIDILCANAGIFPQAKIEDMTPEQWDEVLDTNLKGTFLVGEGLPALPEEEPAPAASSSPRRSPGRSPASPAGRTTARRNPASSASSGPRRSSLRNTASPSTR